MTTLRMQIYNRARKLGLNDTKLSFNSICEKLAVRMFEDSETDTADARAVRKALGLMKFGGVVTYQEPGVE